jgi:hypothetical protein
MRHDPGSRLCAAVAAIALAIVAIAIAAPEQAAASASCESGYACLWDEQGFDGTRLSVLGSDANCCSWRLLSGEEDWWRSAKNRFDNRKLILGTADQPLLCIDHGDNASIPGVFDRIKIGSNGSNC